MGDKEYTELEMGLRALLFALPVLPLMLLWDWPAWYRALAVWMIASFVTYLYGWWIREINDGELEETGIGDEAADATDRNADQLDLVLQLVHVVAPNWSQIFDQPDLVHYNHLPERLNAVVHSVLTELAGDGGIQSHRLASKGNPEIDLFDKDRAALCDYPYVGNGRDALSIDGDVLTFVAAVQVAQSRIIADPGQPEHDNVRHAVGALLTAICEVIEEGYVLVPQFYGDDGEFEEEGDDIAPGLAVAFTAEWEEASK